MNIQHLYYFQSLAKYEHYSIAADEQLTSTSSINYAITTIENEIGLPLFQKVGRNIKLTKYGTIFLDYTNNILNTYENALSEMNDLKFKISSSAKIACVASMSLGFLPLMLATFNEENKGENINFELLQMDTAEMIQNMKLGKVFMGFAIRVDDPEILSYPLFKEEFVLIAPKNKYSIEEDIDDFSAFKDEDFITYDKTFSMYKTITKIFASYDFNPNILYYAPTDSMVADFVSNGLGVAITPNSHMLANYDVDIFNLKNKHYRTLCLHWLKSAPMTSTDKKLKKFILNNSLELANKFSIVKSKK
ncbi:DNA-binding transcriptional regulator, LysR family [Anaerosphaera aminiphila DSM 21120]|uniref:DNA-binding transcriptional regulator, LysR family n=1 Tax=Anaerosphaera aminiphila DSM 21120 TaxID=1120995 RepID=A0A1M5NQE4_9FIRM|nr:LysR family transcriptional regulator [Anaerosphaera aminiphila]SHG91708.1 DNA-binding transcriptional regulator, LysR family [Anaerosphaera aminiphila DSM 21120]